MSNNAVAEKDSESAWSGGKSPFNLSYGKLLMWFFIVSDALTFSGLLCAYGFMRHKHFDVWPISSDVFSHVPFFEGHIPLAFVGLMTIILLLSSITMVLAVEAGHRKDKKKVTLWMLLTIIGGVIFISSQAWEWYHFIVGTEQGALRNVFENGKWIEKTVFGANMSVNEYGLPLFANFFFLITGFHGFHVISGIVLNIVIFINVQKGTYEKRGHYEMVDKTGLYWHFVDLVWLFVFAFFYLL